MKTGPKKKPKRQKTTRKLHECSRMNFIEFAAKKERETIKGFEKGLKNIR